MMPQAGAGSRFSLMPVRDKKALSVHRDARLAHVSPARGSFCLGSAACLSPAALSLRALIALQDEAFLGLS